MNVDHFSPALMQGGQVEQAGAPGSQGWQESRPRTEAYVAQAVRLIGHALAVLENDPGDPVAARTHLINASAFLCRLARHHVLDSSESPSGLVRWKAKKTAAYIEENLGGTLCLNELADLVALSKSHFSREFKRSFGMPPKAFLLSRRVLRAMTLLISGESTLREIASTCGFSDQSHLSRAFRRVLGTPPGRWRAAQLNALADDSRH